MMVKGRRMIWVGCIAVAVAALLGRPGRCEPPHGAADHPVPRLVMQVGHQTGEFGVSSIHALAWSPDGHTIATAGDVDAKLWDGASGHLLATLGNCQNATDERALAWSPDGRTVAAGAKIFDATTGQTRALLRGCEYNVIVAAWSPDGRRLATGSLGKVCVWNTATWALRGTARARGRVYAMAWSPDGRTLAAAGDDPAIKLWDVASGRLRATLRGHLNAVYALAWRPDGRILASFGLGRTVELWDGTTGRLRATLTGGAVSALAWSRDGRTLATGGEDHTVKLWDAADGRLRATMRDHWKAVSNLAWSPDGTTLATAANDHTIKLYSAAGRLCCTFRAHSDPGPLAWSPDGGSLASGDGVVVRLYAWNKTAGHLRATLQGEQEDVTALGWHPDGRNLDSGTALWDRQTGLMRPAPVAHPQGGRSPDGKSVVTSVPGGSGPVRLWDADTGRLRATLLPDAVDAVVAWSPDGRTVAAGQPGNWKSPAMIGLWDAATGRLRLTLPYRSLNESLYALAWSPDGRTLAASSTVFTANGGMVVDGSAVKLWDATSWRLQATLHVDAGRSLAWSPDGHTLATGDNDGANRLWEGATGRLRATLQGRTKVLGALAWSPDGRILASGSRLWDPTTGRLLAEGDSSKETSWSPDGQTLATLDTSAVRLWDRSGHLRTVLQGHQGWLADVAWSPDGNTLCTGGTDGSLCFWNTEGTLLATAVAFKGGDWLVATPQGFFDGSPGGWNKILWRLSANIHDTATPEQYFNDFYQPGLLADVLKWHKPMPDILRDRHDPRADVSIADKDRRQPTVKILAAGLPGPGEVCRQRVVTVRVAVHEAPPDATHARGSGIRGVRLFRNGTLVARWTGTQRSDAVLEAKVTMVAGENALTAYAFNHDNIKSEDARREVRGAASLEHAPQAWVLTVGINGYAIPRFNLRFAAADASALAARLRGALPFPPTAIHVKTLLDSQATRRGVLAALAALAHEAQPEDTVIVAHSGHGLLYQEHLYLIPHDLGAAGNYADLARHGVSDQDLDDAFQQVQAQHIILILDACHSGEALASDEWRQGPMNARGLMHLAWEKGMDVLTASQSQQCALEAWRVGSLNIGHGLLTYALLDGLQRAPRHDGRLSARDWLDYAAARVPQLVASGTLRGRDLQIVPSKPQPVQVPRVFHRRQGGGDWAVAVGARTASVRSDR